MRERGPSEGKRKPGHLHGEHGACALAEVFAAGDERIRDREHVRHNEDANEKPCEPERARDAARRCAGSAAEYGGEDGSEEDGEGDAACVARPVAVGVHDVCAGGTVGEPGRV